MNEEYKFAVNGGENESENGHSNESINEIWYS